jgi:hypothetical protein
MGQVGLGYPEGEASEPSAKEHTFDRSSQQPDTMANIDEWENDQVPTRPTKKLQILVY